MLAANGESGTHLYKVWIAMRRRCNNPNNTDYASYGGRGIKVCSKWNEDFLTFRDWANTHGYDSRLKLDRKNNNGPYSPKNCQWITHKLNCRNRRNSVYLTAFGETKTLAEWAEDNRCVVKEDTLRKRYKFGWEPTACIVEPIALNQHTRKGITWSKP